MNRYAVGVPGAAVRSYIDTDSFDIAIANCGPGELAVLTTLLGPALISADGTSVSPYDEPIPTPSRQYSFNDWVDLWPLEAQIAIAGAAMSNPVVKLIYDRAMAAQYIDMDDPRTPAMIGLLVSQNVVTQEQADIVLNA